MAEEVELEIGECIEELLKYTLQSHVHRSLGFPLNFLNDYCSALLQYDDVSPADPPLHQRQQHGEGAGGGGRGRGVPSYPLYKHLASALHNSIMSGRLCSRSSSSSSNNSSTIPRSSFNEEEGSTISPSGDREELEELISHTGTELLNILRSVNFELHVQEPYFTQIKDGVKKVEGRCAFGKCSRYISVISALFTILLV